MRTKKSIVVSTVTAFLLLQSNMGTLLSNVHAVETPGENVTYNEPMDNIGFSAIPVQNAWDYSVWSNHTDGDRLGSLDAVQNQLLNVTHLMFVDDIPMVYFESATISGWVVQSALHFGGTHSNQTVIPVANAGDFGIWSHFSGGSRLDSLASYQGRQMTLLLEAPNGWVLIQSGDTPVGWVHKSGLDVQTVAFAGSRVSSRLEVARTSVYSLSGVSGHTVPMRS